MSQSQSGESSKSRVPPAQATFWIGTAPSDNPFFPISELPESIRWIRGQSEVSESGYRHVQFCFALVKRGRLATVRSIFGAGIHLEPTRSSKAADYVWKDETSVGDRFEFGSKPIEVKSKTDWENVWTLAKTGDLEKIPPRIRLVSYRTIRAIAADHARPQAIVRDVTVLWGPTGTGKSRRAWDEAGICAYAKCPRSKFWDGYYDQKHIVIDEFRGGIDVAHLLRWLDRYPVSVEIKGSSRPLVATRIWITSNLSPDDWYRQLGEKYLDDETLAALMRRFTRVVHLKEKVINNAFDSCYCFNLLRYNLAGTIYSSRRVYMFFP